jgi:hypothetical protein
MMMRVYIGCSKLGFEELQPLFDVDFSASPEGNSYMEREFGANYIDQGEYEIYDRVFYEKEGYSYNQELLKKLFPFDCEGLDLWSEDMMGINTVFFVKNEAVFTKSLDNLIKITDVLDINKFDWQV